MSPVGSRQIIPGWSCGRGGLRARDLNHSFQQSATQQSTNFESPEVLQLRITQLERALTSMVQQQRVKDQDIQILQVTVQRLEADVFDDIDADGMHTQPEQNLHSQSWRPVALSSTLFSTRTPVLTPRVSHPDEPRPQQHFSPVIDEETEFVMLQKQMQELNHRMSVISAQTPSMSHDANAVFLPAFKALVDEIKHIRHSVDVRNRSRMLPNRYPSILYSRTGNERLRNLFIMNR